MSNKDDLDDTKGLSEFNIMIYSSLKNQDFALKLLAEGRHDDGVYLSMIVSQNIEILKLITFLATSLKNSTENQEINQQDILTHLRNVDYHLEKIVKK